MSGPTRAWAQRLRLFVACLACCLPVVAIGAGLAVTTVLWLTIGLAAALVGAAVVSATWLARRRSAG